MLASVHIKEELTQRPFKSRQALLQHHEARAGQFGGQLEVHLA